MSPMTKPPIYLVAPVRTPIGRFGGALAELSAADLGAAAARACLERAGAGAGGGAAGVDGLDAAAVDQAIFGHGRQAGGGPNTARQVSHRAGVPDERPAWTLNQACGSGLQAILAGARAILTGEAQLVLAGGTESMSNTPYMLPRARWGYRLGHAELTDGMYRDGFNDPLSGMVMGDTAEELADEKGITREAADAYAAESQQRCQAARQAGRFQREIVPVEVETRKGSVTVEADEHPRDDIDAAKLARLKPVFRDDGTVTAGNASGITDGAAAVLVAGEAAVAEHGLTPAARLVDWQVVGVEPRIMGIGPVSAVRQLLARHDLGLDDIEEMELNEAFASQVLACLVDLPYPRQRLNPDGGAIALGHPIGATGCRIVTTLLHGMAERGRRLGIATLCVSGGMGLAALVERVEGWDERWDER